MSNPNIEFIQKQINDYLTTDNYQPPTPPKNNMEIWPYPNWYQGNINDIERPTIMEREAGWNPVTFQRYDYGPFAPVINRELCWQGSCSVRGTCHDTSPIKEEEEHHL